MIIKTVNISLCGLRLQSVDKIMLRAPPIFQVNSTLYISGQIGFVPETMEVIKGGVVPEAQQALTNMGLFTSCTTELYNSY